VIKSDIELRLKKIIQEVSDEIIQLDPKFGIHKLIKHIKGRSSRLLRNEFPNLRSRLSTLWINSYFVSTVGGAPLEIIKQKNV